jgi:hypothetical protein
VRSEAWLCLYLKYFSIPEIEYLVVWGITFDLDCEWLIDDFLVPKVLTYPEHLEFSSVGGLFLLCLDDHLCLVYFELVGETLFSFLVLASYILKLFLFFTSFGALPCLDSDL